MKKTFPYENGKKKLQSQNNTIEQHLAVLIRDMIISEIHVGKPLLDIYIVFFLKLH